MRSACTLPVDAVRTSKPPSNAARQMADTVRRRTSGRMAAAADASRRRLQPICTRLFGSIVSGTQSHANHGAYR